MATTISAVPFNGTKEQEQKLIELIAAHKGQRGALMPVLQGAQEIYGYLPIEVQKLVAQHLEIPLEEVYGVVYFLFSVYSEPQRQIQNFCLPGHRLLRQGFRRRVRPSWANVWASRRGECTNDGKFSLEACRCIGACGLAPVMTINDDVYGRLVADDIAGILAKYAE